jgi:hypothetical protein
VTHADFNMKQYDYNSQWQDPALWADGPRNAGPASSWITRNLQSGDTDRMFRTPMREAGSAHDRQ